MGWTRTTAGPGADRSRRRPLPGDAPTPRRRKLSDPSAAGYTKVTWAEDRATRGRDPSAAPGAKTGVGGRTPPLGIPGVGRNAINPLTCCVISEWRRDDGACPVHTEPVRPQAPRHSRLCGCTPCMRHANALMILQRGPVSACQPRGQTYVRIYGAWDKSATSKSASEGRDAP